MHLHFQGEQHGKGPVDRLFGWGCRWIEDHIQKKPIYGLKDLVACYKAGAQEMVNTDPEGPKFHIASFDPGEFRPEPRKFFDCPGFLITRTYCLTAQPASQQPRGVKVTNRVFSDSDLAAGTQLSGWTISTEHVEEAEDEAGGRKWRRGFYSGERSWEGEGPQAGDVNEIVRRHSAQKRWQPQFEYIESDLQRSLSAKAASLRRAAFKKKRQGACLKEQLQSSSTGSSSSSGSDSSASSNS